MDFQSTGCANESYCHSSFFRINHVRLLMEDNEVEVEEELIGH
jgi:hypothetical protein